MPLMAVISLGFLVAIAKAAAGLGFVIFVHELGHFLVAKACGVKCEKFYVGFDVPIKIGPFQLPRTLFKKQWGETEYGIGIVPLGGYVKMLGQDDNPANSAKEAERIRVAREKGVEAEAEDANCEIDPRSYPAKTVSQRLMIISAGVIMNLIFAIIFGMVAYRMGVSYTPTIVGSASPGLSAWDVGLQTGDRILQLGRDGTPSEHLRFDKDMMVKVMMTGPGEDLDLLVQRYTPPGESASEPEWVTVKLSSPQEELHGRPIIGISQYGTTVIGMSPELRELLGHLPANQTEPALQQGDRIVAVNATPVADYTQLNAQLAKLVDKPLLLDIERPADPNDSSSSSSQLEVTVATSPVHELGFDLTMGPITAVQHGSVGAAAGFQLGDVIVGVQGESAGDPMRLPDVVRRLAGQTIQVEVLRDGQQVGIEVTPVTPRMLHVGAGPNRPVAIEALGIAYAVENVVARVEPDGPASRAGLQVGDLVHTAEFEPLAEDRERDEQLFGRPRPIELGRERVDWPRVHDRMKTSLPGTMVSLTYERDGSVKTVQMLPVEAPDWNYADRGIRTTTDKEIHQVQSWAAAFSLGWRETYESMRQVYFILYRLVTGQLSPMNLGGPASIATMAGLEASESTARLLVFLTLLSANLAVVNFLPIPVLDGGHAMFLLYEGIFRKPMNERVAFGLTMVGFCFVLGLMLFVIGLDVWRFSGLAG